MLQSLTFKIGGKRVLDLSHYLDDYRRKVLSYSASLVTRQERRRVIRQSHAIVRLVNASAGPGAESRIKEIYAEVMLFGSRKPEAIEKEIIKIKEDCARTGASFGNEVSRRIAAVTDPEWLTSFIEDAGKR